MTTFIVSLFLPYTIDFKTDGKHEAAQPSINSVRKQPTVSDSSRLSLLKDNRSTDSIHQIEQDPFFTKPGTVSTPPSFVTRKDNPRGLARTDSTAPEWGRSFLFNQPITSAGSAPPSTVLQYAEVQEKAAKKVLDKLRRRTRNPSTPPKIPAGSEWTVEHALQGNGGLTNAVRAATEARLIEEKHFIGSLGFPTDDLDASTQASIEEKLESEFDSLTVYVKDNDFDGHYRNYCKTILWPGDYILLTEKIFNAETRSLPLPDTGPPQVEGVHGSLLDLLRQSQRGICRQDRLELQAWGYHLDSRLPPLACPFASPKEDI